MNSDPSKSIDQLSIPDLLSQAEKITSLVKSWKKCSSYNFTVPQSENLAVDIHTTWLDGEYWVARCNDFLEFPSSSLKPIHESLLKYSIASTREISKCHTVFEKNYIEELYDFKVSEYPLNGQVDGYESFTYLAELFYRLKWPLKRRRFCNLITVLKATDGSCAYVISIAISPSLLPSSSSETFFIDAQYSSVERLTWSGDKLQWIMATCSDAKGWVPQWLARRSINPVVAKDVPNFMEWASKQI